MSRRDTKNTCCGDHVMEYEKSDCHSKIDSTSTELLLGVQELSWVEVLKLSGEAVVSSANNSAEEEEAGVSVLALMNPSIRPSITPLTISIAFGIVLSEVFANLGRLVVDVDSGIFSRTGESVCFDVPAFFDRISRRASLIARHQTTATNKARDV